jgi:hypothetical protein
MKRLMILALALVPIGVVSVWELSDAATTDTAAASVDRTTALVGEPVVFTSTNPCTTACSLTWRRPDIGLVRFGGVIVGRGEQITLSFAQPGSYQVVLDMGETCDGTSQLVCHSYASVFVDITGAPQPDPVVIPDPAAPDPAAPDPVVVPDIVVPDPAAPDPAAPGPVVVPDIVVPVPDIVVPDIVVPEPAAPGPVVVPDIVVPDPAAPDPAAPGPVVVPDIVVPEPVVVVPDPTTPQLLAPSDLSITTVAGRTRLTWTNPESSATSLILERCKGTGCTSFRPIAVLTTSTTSFIESRIRRGTTDTTYRLAASDSTGTVYSNVEVATVRR